MAQKSPSPNSTGGASSEKKSNRVLAAVAAEAIALPPVRALRRIPLSDDVLAPTKQQTAAFEQNRLQAVSHFYLTLNEAAKQVTLLGKALAVRTMPDQLIGTLHEPDGKAAARVQLQIDLSQLGVPGGGHQVALTNDQGAFKLPLPAGKPYPASGKLSIVVHGSNANPTLTLNTSQIAANGLVGSITLASQVNPLPVSIVASLEALLPQDGTAQPGQPAPAPPQLPQVTLGDQAQCQLSFRTDYSVDRFPYSVFFRLVEPRTSIVTEIFRIRRPDSENFSLFTKWNLGGQISITAETSYVDRTPVEQPISVDGFRDQIIGVDGGATVGIGETVPMAGTLGLGYVLRMAQLWTPQGYALGDLVYSLPLAPGEQEEVAIFERVDTSAVRESELLSVQEQQTLFQTNDASTNATFSSAFNEMAQGGSRFQTDASSSSWGASILIASGGGGSSSSSGSSSEWMSGQRNQVQQAAQDSHAAVARQAAARRDAFRTSMRLASATESETVTTKTITNHNHTHALTLQYWEVLRLFDITTDIEGAELVCLVPLEVVRFLPPGQVLLLDSNHLPSGRNGVLQRYSLVLKHADVLARSLPRQFQYGLTLLRQFASDPTADIQSAASAAEDVINFSLTGTFLPFEEIYVSAVTRRGTRLGPTRLVGSIPEVPDIHNDLKNSFSTKDALLGYLRGRRSGNVTSTLEGNLAIPPSLARNDIIGFELTRRFQRWDYDLVSPEVQTAVILGLKIQITEETKFVSSTIHFSPHELESEVGGPILGRFIGSLLAVTGSGSAGPDPKETYANDDLGGVELPPARYPVPAVQLAPVLKYSQLLEIEKMLQHVVHNTVVYSKAVWWSLTPDERAIMLEGYTIGVPSGGITDESQMVPLLNCVQNKVLGFYGNSMIMPFIIPASVAESMEITSSQVQQMLTQFHKTAFDPPKSIIALPTRGVLGEAVLGHCSSAEKIDLTRFWNWQDSPADTAPQISPVTLPTTQPSIAAGLTAPNTLTGVQPLINNNVATSGGAATPDTSLLTAMVQAAAGQKDFSTELTGASQLASLILNSQKTAESARADALKTTKDLQAQAMATAGNIVGGIYGGNPNAGSSALAAEQGQAPKSSDSSSTPSKTTTGSKGGSGSSGSGGSGGSGSSGSGSGSGGSGSSGSGSGSGGSGSSGSGGGSGGSGSGSGSGGGGSSGGGG